ncbi:LOW QUALITY PROTEIN: hypothetical protein PanWU01x14_214070 [Parasponia andersonii]|uniref:Uncharacterized protein n=1 Tax=Parasponia andersonii TaxID=3476 RepID=A0A2P5BSC2_PARAD|nr:LOW QUALITY PROTEIN: hypothetical protein PanWU01x14_214070 [Parasponia andersonii]
MLTLQRACGVVDESGTFFRGSGALSVLMRVARDWDRGSCEWHFKRYLRGRVRLVFFFFQFLVVVSLA